MSRINSSFSSAASDSQLFFNFPPPPPSLSLSLSLSLSVQTTNTITNNYNKKNTLNTSMKMISKSLPKRCSTRIQDTWFHKQNKIDTTKKEKEKRRKTKQNRERKKEYYQSLNRAKKASHTDLQSTSNESRTGDSLHCKQTHEDQNTQKF